MENPFVTEARTWFNSQFKNTGEYKSATANGKKTPKWKRGIVYNIGNIQFAEFPLITSNKKVYVTESLSDADKLRVVEDTKMKALFIKVPGKPIEVRILQFTPSFSYLKSKNFNLSNLSFKDYTKDFEGNFMMFDFANNLIVGYHYTNDAVKTLKFNPKAVGDNGEALSTEDGCDDVDPNCTYQMTTTYEMICDASYNIDEGFDPNSCTMRVLDFSCVLIGCDTGDDDLQNCLNGGNAMEVCLCNVYGICNGGGGGEDDGCTTALDELTSGVTTSNETIEIRNLNEGSITRTKHYDWKILTSSGGWYIFSFDQGIHERDPNNTINPWKWKELNHNTISLVGVAIGGSIEPSLISATPTIGLYNAVMDVRFKVKYSVVCSISPISYTLVYSSNKMFNIND